MRNVLLGLVLGVLLGGSGAAFAVRQGHVYTGRQEDVFRVPAASTRCVVSTEGGFPDLFCSRLPRGRYRVSFFRERIFIWRNGNPDKPAFSARWKP